MTKLSLKVKVKMFFSFYFVPALLAGPTALHGLGSPCCLIQMGPSWMGVPATDMLVPFALLASVPFLPGLGLAK